MTALSFFDAHQHVGDLRGVPGARSGTAPLAEDVTTRIAMMDRFGIAACAIMPGHSYCAPGGAADVSAINDRLLAYRALAPDRFPVVAGTVDPRHGKAAVAEVERVHALGMGALSWHHRMQGLPMDHPVMFDIVGRMADLSMVVMVHCYANGDFESPWRLRRLADAFPAVSFVALDAMTSPENLEQIVAAARQHDNICLDLTSGVLGADGIRRSVDQLGPDRLLFGTNYYSMGRPMQLEEQALLAAAELPDEATALIAGGNARQIFGPAASVSRL